MPTFERDANSAFSATNSEKMKHLPGSIINNQYQIIQKLGRSETGNTYLAKDLQAKIDGRCVVEYSNISGKNQAHWRIFQQYLLNEVAVLGRLGDHPQIPRLYHHLAGESEFYLIREYIDGDSLEQEVEGRVLDEADTIQLIQDVLRILDFIHKTSVIHRDVQPAHIIRRKQDQKFTLVHFGAIRELEATEINLQGELIVNPPQGNSSYVAPEQKSGASQFASDIYALGKTAIYALTGKSPLKLEQGNLSWQQQCQISHSLESILHKMMSPEVEQRYGSALEVLHDLRPLLRLKQTIGGRYLITHYLGGRGKIATYVANNLHRHYQSPCVIKQIVWSGARVKGKLELEKRFAEELTILEKLGYHEQIPQVWDHFELEGSFYLVQEYFQGENLAQKIAQQNLSVSAIVQILLGTLSVLSFIHHNRVIHRNLKPSNLILSHQDEGTILTDFGILHDLSTLGTQEDQQEPENLNYCSPEQIAGRPTISSDLYALGMIVVEAFTGIKPSTFSRDSQTGKLLWTQQINLERRLIKVVDKMIEPDLGRRYQSADKVAQDLQKINLKAHGVGQLQPDYTSKDLVQINRASKIRSKKISIFKLPIFLGILGIACLLTSIEFAFPSIRPTYYWYRGQKMLSEQPENALNTFTKTIDLKPQSAPAWSGRGDALSILGRYPLALEAYGEAVRLNASVDNWLKQGSILARLDRFSEAIAAYDRALELEPDNGEVKHQRGQALFALQQYPGALKMQDAALEADRFNPRYLNARAQILIKLGRYYDALSTLNRVQAIAPDNLELWQDKYLVLQALNRPQEAARVSRELNNNYLKLLQQEPENQQLWLAQGSFFTLTQMYSKAVASYEQALKLEPNLYQAWLGQGQVLTELEQNQQALTSLDKALEIRPQSYIVLQAQGSVYQTQNQLTQAIASYDRGLSINPNYAPLWRDRGLALNQQQRYQQAAESLEKARNIASYDPQTWQGLAEALLAMGKVAEALSAIDEALEINPRDPNLWNTKGLIYSRNAKYNEACDTYRESRLSIPDSTVITEAMIRLGCRMN